MVYSSVTRKPQVYTNYLQDLKTAEINFSAIQKIMELEIPSLRSQRGEALKTEAPQ